MKKKITFTLVLALSLILIPKVFAYDFTEKEQEYFDEFYGSDYNLTDSEYQWIKSLNIDTNGYEIFDLDEAADQDNSHKIVGTRTTIETTKKKLSASRACSGGLCNVTTIARWKSDPKVRSWDVIGARFAGPSLSFISSTVVNSSSGATTYNNYQTFSNGFGNSVKVPSSGSNISVTQYFTATGSGTIYCSYQHAGSSVSLATSKLYTIGAGSGNVFNFYGAAAGKYDNMSGVYVTL